MLWLSEGDACTKFFHAQVNGRRRNNHIHSPEHDSQTLLSMESKAEAAFSFFEAVMGMPAARSNSISLECLDLPHLNHNHLTSRFTKQEVWNVIWALPLDKAPGSDGFTS
jgi:hypothetical protein